MEVIGMDNTNSDGASPPIQTKKRGSQFTDYTVPLSRWELEQWDGYNKEVRQQVTDYVFKVRDELSKRGKTLKLTTAEAIEKYVESSRSAPNPESELMKNVSKVDGSVVWGDNTNKIRHMKNPQTEMTARPLTNIIKLTEKGRAALENGSKDFFNRIVRLMNDERLSMHVDFQNQYDPEEMAIQYVWENLVSDGSPITTLDGSMGEKFEIPPDTLKRGGLNRELFEKVKAIATFTKMMDPDNKPSNKSKDEIPNVTDEGAVSYESLRRDTSRNDPVDEAFKYIWKWMLNAGGDK